MDYKYFISYKGYKPDHCEAWGNSFVTRASQIDSDKDVEDLQNSFKKEHSLDSVILINFILVESENNLKSEFDRVESEIIYQQKAVAEAGKEIEKLKKELREYSRWQTTGIPKDSKDVYILKIDTMIGWMHVDAIVKNGQWVEKSKTTIQVNNPNYYKLLTRMSE